MRYIYIVVACCLVSCAPAVDEEIAQSSLQAVTAQCIGKIRAGQIDLVAPGTRTANATLGIVSGLEGGKVSANGKVAAGWTSSGLVVKSPDRTTELKGFHLDDTHLGLSRDGTVISFVGRDRTKRVGGLFVVTRDGSVLHSLPETGRNPALHPDGNQVAFEEGGGVRVVGDESKILLTLNGTKPSWSADGSRITTVDRDAFHVVETKTNVSSTLPVRGDPLTPLQWSLDGRAALYVARTAGDFWSSLSCVEQYRVAVIDTRNSSDFIYHVGCSSYPERIQWLPAEVCAAK